MKSARLSEILRLLATNEVEFIVVGMTASILQGVPMITMRACSARRNPTCPALVISS